MLEEVAHMGIDLQYIHKVDDGRVGVPMVSLD
jgi:hypothetical protein